MTGHAEATSGLIQGVWNPGGRGAAAKRPISTMKGLMGGSRSIKPRSVTGTRIVAFGRESQIETNQGTPIGGISIGRGAAKKAGVALLGQVRAIGSLGDTGLIDGRVRRAPKTAVSQSGGIATEKGVGPAEEATGRTSLQMGIGGGDTAMLLSLHTTVTSRETIRREGIGGGSK